MKHKLLFIILGIVVIVLGIVGSFAWKMGLGAKVDLEHPTQFITADFIDLKQIGSISKYRSGEGHDFSAGGETCRSMKHYFTPIARSTQPPQQGSQKELPPAPTDATEIAIYSPVDGQITQIAAEHTPIGEQIYIQPTGQRGYNIRLFHIYKDAGVKVGMAVKAGQRIGRISNLSGTDVAIEAGFGPSSHYLSYFDVMSDSVFAAYQARGVASRSDLIFTKEFRDAHPFKCNGEEFADNYASDPNSGQDVVLNGWTPPTQQRYNNQKNTNQPGNQNTNSNTQSNTNSNAPTPSPISPHPTQINSNTNATATQDVTVTVLNDTTSGIIANKSVSVFVDNGIRCVKAPCPTNSRPWTGTTDEKGLFVLPATYVDQSMSIIIDGYDGAPIPYEQALNNHSVTLRLKPKS